MVFIYSSYPLKDINSTLSCNISLNLLASSKLTSWREGLIQLGEETKC